MSQPKVLFTASSYSHLHTFHRPYLRDFRERGWVVHAACGGGEKPLPEAHRVIFLPFEKKMSSPANFKAQRQLAQLMAEEGYDLIVTHTSLAAFFTRRAAAQLRKRPPLVNMAHGYLFDDSTPALKKSLLLTAECFTAQQTDLLLTMNAWDFRTALQGHLGRRVELIPGIGVDFARLDRVPEDAREALRRRLEITNSDILLLYAAEFSKRKSQETLIRALSQLPEQVKLALPGSGALLEDCRTLARKLGVEQRIRFPGFVTDMPLWYAAADIAVTSARTEGLPFNVMESMYCGLPVVASRVKGHTDLVEDGVTGLLYPYGNADACAAAIRRMAEDPALAAAMGAAGRVAVGRYGIDAVQPLVMEQYLSVLK